jgi:hypothetical protein
LLMAPVGPFCNIVGGVILTQMAKLDWQACRW